MKPNLALVITLVWAASASAITIETVPVGDVGNANDSANCNCVGGVSYAYNIGKYEVTVGQYTAFLNAVAATDTYSLYNPAMATDLNIAGISRSGASGSFTYSVIGSANHPITYVSWGDAARFVNWLHNGQLTGPQNPTTTEDGSYTLNGAMTNAALLAVSRNAAATLVLPTHDEWYKAAYYQPSLQGGDSDNYWRYPMRTNSDPFSDEPPGATPDNTRVGNFGKNDNVDNGNDDGAAISSGQNHLTDVGAYTSSPSYYGTFDQGGNVYEWTESLASICDNGCTYYRSVRGGAWDTNYIWTAAFSSNLGNATGEASGIGFRVAIISIPEPSTILLASVSLPILCLLRRKTVPHNRV